jgi:hypothetical protein
VKRSIKDMVNNQAELGQPTRWPDVCGVRVGKRIVRRRRHGSSSDGLEKVTERYYRPSNAPPNAQPWLATVWRRGSLAPVSRLPFGNEQTRWSSALMAQVDPERSSTGRALGISTRCGAFRAFYPSKSEKATREIHS